MNKIKVTLLVENSAAKKELASEHGLSFLLESEAGCGLFDTGQSGIILKNAQTLGVNLSLLKWIVLSHGHYDHTGGLGPVLSAIDPAASGLRIIAHPAVLTAKYVREGESRWRPAGLRMSLSEIENKGGQMDFQTSPVEVAKDIITTGEIPRKTDFENIEDRFLVEHDGRKVPDLFPDDQALVLRTVRGIVVLVGCAHSGVVNTLKQAIAVSGQKNIYAVIGGMHLVNASAERIRKTIEAFRSFEVSKIGLAHCTGPQAVAAFLDAFGERCLACQAGTVLEF